MTLPRKHDEIKVRVATQTISPSMAGFVLLLILVVLITGISGM